MDEEEGKKGKKKGNGDGRREKSLGLLSQKFVQMFLLSDVSGRLSLPLRSVLLTPERVMIDRRALCRSMTPHTPCSALRRKPSNVRPAAAAVHHSQRTHFCGDCVCVQEPKPAAKAKARAISSVI
jgi:hypothetical protein